MPSDSSPIPERENIERHELSRVGGHSEQPGAGSYQQASDAPSLPSKEDILHMLAQLPGCVAIGVLPPTKANSMRSIYDTMLRHSDGSVPSGVGAIEDGDVLKVLRDNPEMLKFMKPFLSKEQIALVIREAPHD